MSGHVEGILPNLYRVEVPLPGSPLRAVNSYVVKGGDCSLVVDTGWNRDSCIEVLTSGLEELCLSLHEVDFFITHYHADHWGMVPELVTATGKVYVSRSDAEVMGSADRGNLARLSAFALRHGFPRQEAEASLQRHPGRRYISSKPLAFTLVEDGDIMTVGDYSLRCIETPGHTAGHMCLYDPEKRLLLSGDHILGDITPNISLWADGLNPLGDYLSSLEKMRGLDTDVVLPAHGRPIAKPGERIEELQEHHHVRLAEVMAIVERGPKSAYQVASQMTWQVRHGSWSDFPVGQKWFAVSEALAHLVYLERTGQLRRVVGGETVLFTMA